MGDKDELIFFEPPNNANKLPQGQILPMFYFDTSRTVLIPSIGYDEGKNDDNKKEDVDQKKKVLTSVINSLSKMNGAMLVLSFHVESSDVIRCYLSINGQIIRFMPSDIQNLLPAFFDT